MKKLLGLFVTFVLILWVYIFFTLGATIASVRIYKMEIRNLEIRVATLDFRSGSQSVVLQGYCYEDCVKDTSNNAADCKECCTQLYRENSRFKTCTNGL